jgi:hypothetical protein
MCYSFEKKSKIVLQYFPYLKSRFGARLYFVLDKRYQIAYSLHEIGSVRDLVVRFQLSFRFQAKDAIREVQRLDDKTLRLNQKFVGNMKIAACL